MLKMKLSEVCLGITDGSHNPPDGIEKSDFPMISSKNVYDDRITLEDPRYLSQSDFLSEDKRTQIKPGDVLLTIVGTVGRSAVVDEDIGKITLQRSVAVLHTNCDICSSRYLMYLLQSKRRYLEQEARGAAQKGIYLKQLSNMEVVITEKSNQDRIVEVLDEVNGLIRLKREQIIAYDDLVKSLFVEMFGDAVSNPKKWKKEEAERHIDLLSGYPFKSEQYVDFGVNICGGLIIMPQRIEWDSCVHWATSEGYEDYLLDDGDIVMALDRPWITEGFKIARVDAAHLPALLIQRTARIRAIDVNQDYLYYCFVYGGFEKHTNVTGSLVPHISAKDIKSFEIMLPPIELQNQFADFIQHVDKLKVKEQKNLEKAQLLFDSLMQQYFG